VIEPPPRDEDGKVIPHDHSEINDNDEVIRRISERQIILDKNGNRRISSMAYKDAAKRSGMSVDLKQLIERDGLDPKEYVTTPRWTGSVLFKVVDLRQQGFMVGYDPIEPPKPEPNSYHGEVWSELSENQAVRKLKSMAEWFVPIPEVNLT
jgi:hypothetical protein